ncbi:MAG TPA: hypothetical protein ENI38_01935 [Candidatus Acetothermia bacterium]|nr:hypothetical protein [Candidatus Acetothermia bacterium]
MDPKLLELGKGFLTELLRLAGEALTVEGYWEEDGLYLNLVGRPRRLPEEETQFRADLTRLVRLHLQRWVKRPPPVVVDLNGRWAARRRSLVELAREAAQRAMEEKHPIKLDPMPPDERRVIHLALAEFPGVRTYSVGQGPGRRVVIEPLG